MVRRRVYLSLFLILFTLLMAGYAAVVFLFPLNVLYDLHTQVPGTALISSYLGIVDPYTYDTEKSVLSETPFLPSSQRHLGTGTHVQYDFVGDEQQNRFLLVGLPKSGNIYAPVFTFDGQVSSGAVALRIFFTHEGRHLSKEVLVDSYRAGDTDFSFTVGLHRDTLYAGTNSYLLEVEYQGGEKLSKRVDLRVEYDRLSVGEQTLFIDTHLIPDTASEDIVRSAKDLEGNDTYFITYGCDPFDQQPPLLIKDVVEYKVVPACLSFSLAKGYMLLFTYASQTSSDRLYTIDRGSLGVLSEGIPLYYSYFGGMFYTLVFYDPLTDQLSTLRAWGDAQKNDLQLMIKHLPTNSIDLQIDVYGGTQIQILTRTEKMIFYLYKERDNKTSLIHPGTRFQYFRKSPGDRWTKVNEGQAYSLPVRIIAPSKGNKPTFTLDFTTDGVDITLTDGVRRIDLKKNALRSSLHTTQLTSQYTDCSNVKFGAFGSLFGDQYRSYSLRNPVLLLASGLPESGVTLSYDDEVEQFTPDQLFGGYLYHSLRYPNKGLHKGVNTYTLHIKNTRNNDMCTKKVTVVVE